MGVARFWFKSERRSGRCTGSGCSTVYAPPGQNHIQPKGKASLGRVCYRDGAPRDRQWEAVVSGTTGYGPTKSEAVRDALRDAPIGVSLWTTKEVASMTGIPVRTLRYWVKAGYLKSWGDGHAILVTCGEVQEAARSIVRGKHGDVAQRCPCDAQEGT